MQLCIYIYIYIYMFKLVMYSKTLIIYVYTHALLVPIHSPSIGDSCALQSIVFEMEHLHVCKLYAIV